MKEHRIIGKYKCCGMCKHFQVRDYSLFGKVVDFSGEEWGGCKHSKGAFSYMLCAAAKCPHFRKRFLWKYRPFKRDKRKSIWEYWQKF